MKLARFLTIVVLLSFLLESCAKYGASSCAIEIFGDADLQSDISLIPTTETPFFPNSKQISLPDYSYFKDGNSYSISPGRIFGVAKGNCSFLENIVVHNTNPRFVLPSLSSKLVAMCISDKLLEVNVEKQRIENLKDIFWTWNSGMKTLVTVGGNLTVDYDEGRLVDNGKIDTITKVSPLAKGRIYYFSVWTWNESGTIVSESSACIPFMVQDRAYSFSNYYFLANRTTRSKWTLISAYNESLSLDITRGFPAPTLTFEFVACNAKNPASTIQLVENDVIVQLLRDTDDSLIALGSSIFKDKLHVIFLCSSKLQFKTIINNEVILLTYVR